VKTRADWDALKERLAVDVGDGARVGTVSYFVPFERYPSWAEMRSAFGAMRGRERFIVLWVYGPYEHCWRMCGYTEAMMMLVAEPAWAEDVFATHTGLLLGILRRALDEGIRIDGLFVGAHRAARRHRGAAGAALRAAVGVPAGRGHHVPDALLRGDPPAHPDAHRLRGGRAPAAPGDSRP